MNSKRAPWFLLRGMLALVILIALGEASSSATTAEKILFNFNGYPHGYQPYGGLVADAQGTLYGTAWLGGAMGVGGVFKLAPNAQGGWTQTMIHSFSLAEGGAPQGEMIFDSAGNLYGINGNGAGTIFELTPQANGQWTETTVYAFQGGSDGQYPNGPVALDAAGNLYGIANEGGANGCGLAFELSLQANGSWKKATIYSFGCGTAASSPSGGVIFDGSGNLYGVTEFGGTAEYGTVYELVKGSGGTWTEQTLYSFPGGAAGNTPLGALTFDKAGNLFGSAEGGASTACNGPCGVIFELTPSNGQWSESVVHNFNESDGDYPRTKLVFDGSGNLYGTTIGGGKAPDAAGAVFELVPGTNGVWSERLLWSFTRGLDGGAPRGSVVLGAEGKVYTTASTNGGLNGNGTVIQLTPTATGPYQERTLTNLPDGNGPPLVGVIRDAAGNFYGTTSNGGKYGFGAVYELTPKNDGFWKITILYNFPTGNVSAGQAFGATPSSLIFDAAGNLYGETGYGGSSGNGIVYELAPAEGGNWTEKDLYDFSGGADGSFPQGGLIFDRAGNLYGTTKQGGVGCKASGCGTVFELSTAGSAWSKTIVYNFAGGGSDGLNPVAGVILDAAGNLYGTTEGGGIQGPACDSGCGTMFELSPSAGGWKETFVHLFSDAHGDGASPQAGLIFDRAGNLYGTTELGGNRTENCGRGCGTVFEFSPISGGGWNETVIYAFPGASFSSGPFSGLVFDGAGNLYGTIPGIIFELSPAAGGGWTESTYYTFPAVNGFTLDSYGTMLFDAAGNLYGTTAEGGVSGGGTVFEITP